MPSGRVMLPAKNVWPGGGKIWQLKSAKSTEITLAEMADFRDRLFFFFVYFL